MTQFRTSMLGLFFKNITKSQKSAQYVLRVCYVTNIDKEEGRNYSDEIPAVKIPTFRKIAMEENFDWDKFLVKPQDTKDLERIFEEIAQGDAEVEKQLQLLLYEISLYRQEEHCVPNVLLKKHWEELLGFKNVSARQRYLHFLFKSEKKKESERIKNALKKREYENFKELYTLTPHIYYGLKGYSMFIRVYSQTLHSIPDARAVSNKLFASPILYDCSYQDYMNNENTKNCARQLMYVLQSNRSHQYPCSLHLVNLKKNDALMKYLQMYMPNINDTPLEVSEESYLDLYPKEKLVYLTPHCKKELVNFNDDDIYIIGAYVDKGHGVQASLAKAKENGLRMAKLPLDNYLWWRSGTKSLTLNNVLDILLDMRYYRNWQKALQNIPTRNLRV